MGDITKMIQGGGQWRCKSYWTIL